MRYRLILALENRDIFFLIINMDKRTHTCTKYYDVFTKPTTIIGNEKRPLASNPIPKPEYLYWSESAFLVNLTAPQKKFPSLTC